jgi:hypothetical protein
MVYGTCDDLQQPSTFNNLLQKHLIFNGQEWVRSNFCMGKCSAEEWEKETVHLNSKHY